MNLQASSFSSGSASLMDDFIEITRRSSELSLEDNISPSLRYPENSTPSRQTGIVRNYHPPCSFKNVCRYPKIEHCEVSNDGRTLLLCHKTTVTAVDITNRRYSIIRDINVSVGRRIAGIAFSHDNDRIAVTTSYTNKNSRHNGGIFLTNIRCSVFSPLLRETHHTNQYIPIKFSPTNLEIATGSAHGEIVFFDTRHCTCINFNKIFCGPTYSLSYMGTDSNVIATGGDAVIKVIDQRNFNSNNATAIVFRGHTKDVTHVTARGDNRYLISHGADGTVKLWDCRQPGGSSRIDNALKTYEAHCIQNRIFKSRFSPMFTTGQRYIYKGCACGSLMFYDGVTGETKKYFKQFYPIHDAVWHPFRNEIITVNGDGIVHLWKYTEDSLDEPSIISDLDLLLQEFLQN